MTNRVLRNAVRPVVCKTVRNLVALYSIAAALVLAACAQTQAQPTRLAPQPAAHPSSPTFLDFEANRINVARLVSNWQFQNGDDPNWANPSFDDSSWKPLKPLEDWDSQGFAPIHGMAWFRIRLRVPASLPAFTLSMPELRKSYQIFVDGKLDGQLGRLPPESPLTPTRARHSYTLPLANAKLIAGTDTKETVIAIRLWIDPQLARLDPNILPGTPYIGDTEIMGSMTTLLQAQRLLDHGEDYTQTIIELIVGAAGLLLFQLTRRNFYLWFALSMLVSNVELPLHLVSEDLGWGFFGVTYTYSVLDFLNPFIFSLFVLAALDRLRWRWVALFAALGLLTEMGPIFFLLGSLSQGSADGLYVFFDMASEAVILALLVKAWRAGDRFARLLFFPTLLAGCIAIADNLGYFLADLHVPHIEAMNPVNIVVFSNPFFVDLSDVGGIISTLGMLAVLVYQFAKSSREEQRLKTALQTAHDIQQSLVPVDIPRLGALQTEIVYLAAEEVGGDFCQVLPRADNSVLIVIGDVSGKGLQAAMVGSLAVGALRSMADEGIGPAETLKRLNNVLLRTENRGFITCLCIVIFPSGQLTLANAGHLSPYLDGEEMPTASGLPLGIVHNMEYGQLSFTLPPAARLTLISDGVVEARSATGELYGFDRTCSISSLPAKEIAARANSFGQEDDITVITLDWRPHAIATA